MLFELNEQKIKIIDVIKIEKTLWKVGNVQAND